MPDPYRPDEDPAFYPDETGRWSRRRDQSRRDAERRAPGRGDPERSDPGRRMAGRLAPEPPDLAPRDPGTRDRARRDAAPRDPALPASGPRDGALRDPGTRDRALRDPGTRERLPRDPAPRDRALRDPGTRERLPRDPASRDRALRGPDARGPGTRDRALRDAAPRDRALREMGIPEPPVVPDPGPLTDPRSRDWGQLKPGQIETRQRGPRRGAPGQNGRGPNGPGRDRPGRRHSSPDAPSWRWGELPGGRATLIVLATAIAGTGATVAMHRAPGPLLGGAIIAGTLTAVLAVRRGAVYQLIPVPALAYMVGALAAGLLQQQNAGPSGSGLAVSATQWVAGGFVTMAIATALAVAVTVIRWLMSWRAGSPGSSRDREPEPLASDRPTSRTVFPSAPDTGSWRARPAPPRPDPGAEPPSWPWPEEPAPRSKRAARRDPAPPTEPFFRPNKSSSRALPPAQPRSPSPGRSPRPEPPSWPGPPSFGASRD